MESYLNDPVSYILISLIFHYVVVKGSTGLKVRDDRRKRTNYKKTKLNTVQLLDKILKNEKFKR